MFPALILILPLLLATALVCLLVATFFRRPIELPGLALVFLAYLTLGLCSAKFQQLQPAWLAYSWIIASLICAVLLLAFPFAYVLRRRPSPALIAAGLTLTLLFGVATGYAETLTDADQSMQRWSGFDSWWYGLLSLPAGQGTPSSTASCSTVPTGRAGNCGPTVTPWRSGTASSGWPPASPPPSPSISSPGIIMMSCNLSARSNYTSE